MKTEILRLNLITPLYYTPVREARPFDLAEEIERASGTETLFCFELDRKQYRRFEPERPGFLKNLLFGGTSAERLPGKAQESENTACVLPRGSYLFAQERELLNKDGIIALAVEIQQEGLWQRLEPGEKLYLRRLFEDSCFVTQLFRPYTKPLQADGAEA